MEKNEDRSHEERFYELARGLSLSKKVLACCIEYEKPASMIERAEIDIAVTEQDIDDLLNSYNRWKHDSQP